MDKMILATSIAPYQIENQQLAVLSWIKAGFQVISCNAQEEIDGLEGQFQGVKFIPLIRDGRSLLGKPFPYIFDLLQCLKQEGIPVCGIINSDIHIKNWKPEILRLMMQAVNQKGLLAGRRMEVSALGETGTRYDFGFDFFLFPSHMIEIYEDDGLFIGNCMWDYWFLYIACLHHITIYEIKNPLFYHISHPVRWDQNLMEQFSLALGDKYFSGRANGLKNWIMGHLHHINWKFSWILPEVESKTVLVVFPEGGNKESLESLQRQSHKNTVLKISTNITAEEIQQDYIFYASGFVVYEECFLDLIIHEMILHNKPAACALKETLDKKRMDCNIYELLSNYIDEYTGYLDTCYNVCSHKRYGDGNEWFMGYQLTERTPFCWADLIAKKTEGYKTFYIYPAGDFAKRVAAFLQNSDYGGNKMFREQFLGFCDQDFRLKGTSFMGFPVYPAKQLIKAELYDLVFIISDFYRDEIYQELTAFLPKDKVVFL